MAQALWSGNLRLSRVLIPVKLYPAVSTEGVVSFRMIHKPSGKPIRYVKGIETERGFKEVPEEEIVKGYEHTKGQHVLIDPREIEELKLEAKHTINTSELDARYFEKPYYLCPDGEDDVEGYAVMREALAKTGKIALGQLVIGGRQHIVGIMAQGKGLMLLILRYADEVRDVERYFEPLADEAKPQAVALARELIEKQSGSFEPETMPNEYGERVRELAQAKLAQEQPSIVVEADTGMAPPVVNIMQALKESMQARGRSKLRAAARRRMGKGSGSKRSSRSPREGCSLTSYGSLRV
jgi:DNA end-binding protein Ku